MNGPFSRLPKDVRRKLAKQYLDIRKAATEKKEKLRAEQKKNSDKDKAVELQKLKDEKPHPSPRPKGLPRQRFVSEASKEKLQEKADNAVLAKNQIQIKRVDIAARLEIKAVKQDAFRHAHLTPQERETLKREVFEAWETKKKLDLFEKQHARRDQDAEGHAARRRDVEAKIEQKWGNKRRETEAELAALKERGEKAGMLFRFAGMVRKDDKTRQELEHTLAGIRADANAMMLPVEQQAAYDYSKTTRENEAEYEKLIEDIEQHRAAGYEIPREETRDISAERDAGRDGRSLSDTFGDSAGR